MCARIFCRVCWRYLNLDLFYLFLQVLYTGIVEPAYMRLVHTNNDHNQAYAKLNLTQANSETTERSREPDYLEPVDTIKYQNILKNEDIR